MNKKTKRWLLLDNLKALIVAFMITGHTLIWWYSGNSDRIMVALDNQYYEPLLGLFFMVINALVMSLPLTAGMALFFSLRSREKITHTNFFTWLITRVGIIFGIGLLINYLAWGSRYIWTWDVLQFYALASLLLAIIFRYGPVAVGGLLAIVGIGISQYPELGSQLPEYGKIILWGDLKGDHFWPFFPWISIVIVGYFLSSLYQKIPQKFCFFTLITGVALAMTSLLLQDSWYIIDFNNVWGPEVFKPQISTILMQLGLALLVTSFLEKFQSEKSRHPRSLTQSFSQGILVIYMANIVLGFHLTKALEQWIPSLLGLWIAIFSQLILAYGLGLLFIRLKPKLRLTKN